MFTKRIRIINNYYITIEEHWFDLKPHDYLQLKNFSAKTPPV